MAEKTLAIEGMHCDACVRRVTRALAAVPGLEAKEVTVGSARVRSLSDRFPADEAIAALEKAGFAARLVTD